MPPQLVQVLRTEEGRVRISFSEGISAEELRRRLQSPDPGSAMTLRVGGVPYGIEFHGAAPQANDFAQPPGAAKAESRSSVAHATQQAGGPAVVPQDGGPIATLELVTIPGLESGRILRLAATPPIPDGATVEIVFQPEAVQDPFQNHPVAPIAEAFPWPATSGAILDSTAPAVEKVIARPDQLAILFSEEVSPESVVAAVKLDGQSLPWQSCGNAFTYCAPATVSPGPHQVTVGTAIEDLSGKPLSGPISAPFRLDNATGAIAYDKPDERELQTSVALNLFGFQGLPRDPETGFLYVRNRYYDPEMGRFTTPDPLGYVDGPSEYSFAANSPDNHVDPLGLFEEDFHFYAVYYLAMLALGDPNYAREIAFASQFVDDYAPTAPTGWSAAFNYKTPKFQAKLRDFHFLDPVGLPLRRADRGNLMAGAVIAEAVSSRNPRRVGIAIHGVADTFAHEGFSWQENAAINARPGRPCSPVRSDRLPPIGHAQACHDPDEPFRDPWKAADAGLWIYRALRDYGAKQGLVLPNERSEEDLQVELWSAFSSFIGDTEHRVRTWQMFLEKRGMPGVVYQEAGAPSGLHSEYILGFARDAAMQEDLVERYVQDH